MADERVKSARAVAVQVLNRCDPEKNYAGPILDKLLGKTEQRQRATDLVFGTMRNRRAIDTVIATFSGRPVQRIKSPLLNIIRVAVYEFIFSVATQEYAIVNEAVEVVFLGRPIGLGLLGEGSIALGGGYLPGADAAEKLHQSQIEPVG